MFPLLLPLPAEQFIAISKHLSASGYSTRRACFQRSASLHTTLRKGLLQMCERGAVASDVSCTAGHLSTTMVSTRRKNPYSRYF